MELTNRAAYLKGLIDGLKLSEETDEGKIIIAMAELVQDLAVAVEDISDEVDMVVDTLDDVAEEIADLEDDIYGEVDDDWEEESWEDGADADDNWDDFGDEPMYECVCPNCGDTIMLGEGMVEEGSIDCPNCGENLEFDFSELEDED
ncbi:MAG: hypothetical protein IJ571_07865 [Ruminococcus sp.]|nr:hypothetical protein [Ruminococcus sp.]